MNKTVLFNVPRANMLAVLKSASLMSYNYTGEQQQGGLFILWSQGVHLSFETWQHLPYKVHSNHQSPVVVLFYSSAHHSQLCLAKMQPTFVKPLLLKHQCCLIKLPTNRCLFVIFALKTLMLIYTANQSFSPQ